MDPSESSEPEPPAPGRWYQFGLGKLFLITTLVAVVAAGWAAMARIAEPARWSPSSLVAVIVLVLAAPTALLIVVSLFHCAQQWLEHRRR